MKKAIFIFVLLFICNFLQAQTKKEIEEAWKKAETLKRELADLKGKYDALQKKYDSMLRIKDAEIARLRYTINSMDITINSNKNTINILKKEIETMGKQDAIAALQAENTRLLEEKKQLVQDTTTLRQTISSDSAIIKSKNDELETKKSQLALAYAEIARLKANVIDRIAGTIFFNGKAPKFGQDVIFYPTKSDDRVLTLSDAKMLELVQFIELVNKTPEGIEVMVVGRYISGKGAKERAIDRAMSIAQLLRDKGLKVEMYVTTEAEKNNANHENNGVGIYLNGETIILIGNGKK